MILAAFDPGITGAYCLLASDNKGVVALDQLPTLKIQHGRTAKIRNELDLHALKDVLVSHRIDHAFIERVAAMPKQGVTSMFRFGNAAGSLLGLLIGLGIPVTFVRPQDWQRYHSIGTSPDAAKQRALLLFPAISALLSRRKDDQRADAS